MTTCATCRAPMACPEVSELVGEEWVHWHRACRAPSILPRPARTMTIWPSVRWSPAQPINIHGAKARLREALGAK